MSAKPFRDPRASRGYRNCNPGNIEHNERNKWLGLDSPPSDGRFCRFKEHRYGIRALAILLMAYQDRHGCRTVDAIIRRYAPSNENPTRRYVAFVARRMGVAADEVIDCHDPATMFALVEAIIAFELGGQPYTEDDLWQGLEMAGFKRPRPRRVIEAAATDTGRAAATTAGTMAATMVALQELAPVVDAVMPWFSRYGLYGALVIVALGVTLAVWAWRARRE